MTRLADWREYGVALTAGTTFAGFFSVYPTASLILTNGSLSPGTLAGILMAVVVLIQPVAVLTARWLTPRVRAVRLALILMLLGAVTMPLLDHWLGVVLFGSGFGLFVISCTAWAKEVVEPHQMARALGLYGFANAIGGLIGAPLGMFLVTQIGPGGTLTGAAVMAGLALVPTATVKTLDPGSATTRQSHPTAPRVVSARVRGAVSASLVTAPALGSHLLAVSVYAVILSSMSVLSQDTSASLVVLATATTQLSVAVGRLFTGMVIDRWPAGVLGATSMLVLAAGGLWYFFGAGSAALIVSAALVGFAAGVVQTAALTVLMRRADTRAQTDRASAAWNIVFDIGLGAGAYLAPVLF